MAIAASAQARDDAPRAHASRTFNGPWSWLLALVTAAAAALAGCGGGGGDPLPSAQEPAPKVQALPATQDKHTQGSGVHVEALLPVAVRRISWAQYEFDYRLVLKNNGPAVDGVQVRLLDPAGGITVIDGTVDAGTLAADSRTVPGDKITIRKGLLPLFLLLRHEWQITFGPPILAGTAAVGAALAFANVTITDTAGAAACAEAVIVTSGTGAFRCSVLPGRSAPFLVVVTDPSGAYPPLVSVATTAPAPGTSLVVNATPLTTAIVGQLAPDGNPLSVIANPALIDLATLAAITANVLTQIEPVLTALGAPAGYDPFTTQIVPATPTQAGNTADQVIETLRITTVAGVTQIATVDNPAAAVPLANATTSNPPVLPPPAPALLSLADTARAVVTSLAECFALPVASRVLAVDITIPATSGGPTVTAMAPACQGIAHADYLHSGFRFGQRYYGLLNDPAMVGAQFMAAEIMLYLEDASAADNDVAVLNIRFVDANGAVANLIETLRKLPGSATAAHPSDWWLHGDRRPVDSTILSYVRRQEQRAPAGTPPFTGAPPSRFEAGLNLYVNKDGPGSEGLRAARVTGPGLPPAGIVLTRPNPAIITDQNWLNIRRKDGLTDPAAATPADDVGNIFRLQRTQGVAGAAATAVQPNPNAGNSNTTQFPNWAHPLDYGAPIGTPTNGYIDFAQLGPFNAYTFEIFYNGDVAPRHTFTVRTLTAVVPATYAVNLRWLALTPATLGYLDPVDPLAAATSSMNIGWIADPFAETVRVVGVFTFGGGVSVNDAIAPVVRGATGTTAVAPGGATFPVLTNDGQSSRNIQLRYRNLDGGYKDSTTRYN